MKPYHTIIIGTGLAGLTTACLLAGANKKVLLVAQGAGALLLASGAIDVLGYHPADSREPVHNPAQKLPDFLAERPEHPFCLVGPEQIRAGLEAFLSLVKGRLDYQGSLERNWLLPGPAGVGHPTCLAPVSLANGDLNTRGRMLVIGFDELRDFYPALISQNLNEQKLGVQVAALTIDAPWPIAGKMNVTPIELARAFEQPEFRQQVVKAVKSASRGYGRVGFPAVLGLERHAEVMADLQRGLGKVVFEVSTLPPSVPGRRLFDALQSVFLAAGGRLLIGSKVVDGVIENGRVQQIRLETASRLKPVVAENYVLATGGIFGGGIQTDGEGKVWEPIFDLPVIAEADRHQWFEPKFLSAGDQPIANYGVKVNRQLNPVDESGMPLAKNLFVTGATLAGSNWIVGRTGDGVALATAATVVATIVDRISRAA
ncbi:MAG: anaerobic glycerol-3-phosphate dehydrogenase subunit B [Anaerolineae bacterium]|nr:anaerobic glycerol-3-phosphate dehydrogenase subunit B [Anaerolineae bacterium]